MPLIDRLGVHHAIAHGCGGGHGIFKDGQRLLLQLFEVIQVEHEAHADLVVGQRDHPEPRVLAAHDEDVPLFLALGHEHAAVVAEDGDLFVAGVVLAQLLAVGGEVVQAARIHEEGSRDLLLAAVLGFHAEGDAVFFHFMAGDERFFTHLGTEFLGVTEQDVVKLGPLDLDGFGKLRERTAGEIQPRVHRAIAHPELRSALRHETGGLDLFPYAEFVKNGAVIWQERFTDVKARKLLLFE